MGRGTIWTICLMVIVSLRICKWWMKSLSVVGGNVSKKRRQNGFRSFRWNIQYGILSGLHKEIVSLILFVILYCTGKVFKCCACMHFLVQFYRQLISETKIKETSHQGCNPNQFGFIAQLIHICKCLSAGRYIIPCHESLRIR